jgi:Ca-activated chloride channel family protein
MPARVHIERTMHRSSIAVAGESAACYGLIKLMPSVNGTPLPLPLNLALVLDVSGSMYEEDGLGISRLDRLKGAVCAALAKLRPENTVAVVAFAYEAKIVLPPTRLTDLEVVENAIRNIDCLGIDPGGTALDQGITLGLEEIRKNADPRGISHLLLVTDGETCQGDSCRLLAQEARDSKIRLTAIGAGTEWNETLAKDLVRINDGDWCYLDVCQDQEFERVFLREFERLSGTMLTNVEMHLRPVKDVRVKRIRQVVPEMKDLALTEAGERRFVVGLGTLEIDQAKSYILEMSLPRRPDGKYVISQMEISYETGAGQRETSGWLPLEIQYTASGNGYVNPEVAKHIDEVQIFELNNSLQKALAAGDSVEAHRLAENIAKKGDLLGPRGALKTMLARQMLEELRRDGRASKKTRLAVDDAARWAEKEKEDLQVSADPVSA